MESVDELLLYGLRNSLSKDNEHIFSLGHKTISDLNADDLIRCLGKAFRVILNDDTIPGMSDTLLISTCLCYLSFN